MAIKLITALGNNEEKYFHTRHNIGFRWLDQLAEMQNLTWQKSSHGKGMVGKINCNNQSAILLFKPGLLMNINGKPIADCARYFTIKSEEILLVYDDLDLEAGIIKCRRSVGHGGHNGVRDLANHIDISQTIRLKIGIGRPDSKLNTSQYVLQKPSPSDSKNIDHAIKNSLTHRNLLFSGQLNAYCEQLALINKMEKPNGI